MAGDKTVPGEPDAKESKDSGGGMFGAVERLLAAGAILGAALYVLVNGLYIEFYDDFGVRPEQVGFDRLAVLARSAWVALVAVALTGPVAYLAIRSSEKKKWRAWEKAYAKARDNRSVPSAAEDAEVARLASEGREIKQQLRRLDRLGIMLLSLSIVLLVGFAGMAWRVDNEAERVARGQSANGIGFLVPFIDVRANRAEVAWVDTSKEPPPGLEDAKYLMYLGSGDGVTVLVECGTKTFIVPSGDVVVTLLDQGNASDAVSDEDQEAALDEACG